MKNENKLVENLATWFGLGNSKIMPGTVGTLGAIPVVILLSLFNSVNIYFYFMMSFVFFSIFISGKAEKIYGEKDAQNIVIDEVIGYIVTMFLIPISIKTLIIGFLLFRFFDITKIYPIKKLQDIKGGVGVVIDDVAAGLVSNVILWILILTTQFI